MLKIIGISATAALLFASSAFAENSVAVADKKVELGAGIYADFEGARGDSLSNHVGLSVNGSYRFTPNWSATGYFTYTKGVEYGGYDPEIDVDIYRYMASVNYDLTPEASYSPYLLALTGYEDFKNAPDFRDGVLVGGGAGLHICLSESIGANIAGMYKLNVNDGDEAVIVNATLNYRF